MTLKVRDAKAALLKKGFRREESRRKKRDHEFYFYYHEGTKTNCWTKFSSSHTDLSNSLFTSMALELQLDKTQQVKNLFECPLDEEGLKEILRAKGSIRPKSSEP